MYDPIAVDMHGVTKCSFCTSFCPSIQLKIVCIHGNHSYTAAESCEMLAVAMNFYI